jgi:Proteasome assembly chaperone 4
MGPLIAAMPRTQYNGAFSSVVDPSTSKLIGCDSEDAEILARQMSARLSQRLGIAIFVSCSFAGAPAFACEGLDESMLQHRAGALAEREIYRILRLKQLASKIVS